MSFSAFTFNSKIGDKDFPLNVKRMEPQGPTVFHDHEFTELVIVYAGSGDCFFGDADSVRVATGDFFVIPRKKFCHRYDNPDNLCLFNVLYEENLLPLPLLDVCVMPGFNLLFGGGVGGDDKPERPLAFRLSPEALERLLPVLEELETLLKTRAAGYQFGSIGLFTRVIHALSIAAGAGLTAMPRERAGVSRAIGYLHRHFASPELTIPRLAAETNMSMSGLLRHFKRQQGLSPKAYLTRLRIKHACEMLMTSDWNVSEIAIRCGFEDSNYFSREFKKTLKLSPTEFRKRSSQATG